MLVQKVDRLLTRFRISEHTDVIVVVIYYLTIINEDSVMCKILRHVSVNRFDHQY